jgi:hypothetical protein
VSVLKVLESLESLVIQGIQELSGRTLRPSATVAASVNNLALKIVDRVFDAPITILSARLALAYNLEEDEIQFALGHVDDDRAG